MKRKAESCNSSTAWINYIPPHFPERVSEYRMAFSRSFPGLFSELAIFPIRQLSVASYVLYITPLSGDVYSECMKVERKDRF